MLEGHNYEVLVQKEGKRGVIRHSEIVNRRLVLFKDNAGGYLPGRDRSLLACDLHRPLYSAFLEGHIIVQWFSFEEECQRSEKKWLVLSPVNGLQVLLQKILHHSRFVHIESLSVLSNGLIGDVDLKLGVIWRQLASHMRLILQAARLQAHLIVQRLALEEQAEALTVFFPVPTLVDQLLLKLPDGEHFQVLLKHGAHGVCTLDGERLGVLTLAAVREMNRHGSVDGKSLAHFRRLLAYSIIPSQRCNRSSEWILPACSSATVPR